MPPIEHDSDGATVSLEASPSSSTARFSAGQIVAVMEAMKMENNLIAQKDGVVKDVRVQKGTEVSTGDVIMVIG